MKNILHIIESETIKFMFESINPNKLLNFNELLEMIGIHLGVVKKDGKYPNPHTMKSISGLLRRAYQNAGEQGVIDLFGEYTGLEIESIGSGRYRFKQR